MNNTVNNTAPNTVHKRFRKRANAKARYKSDEVGPDAILICHLIQILQQALDGVEREIQDLEKNIITQ